MRTAAPSGSISTRKFLSFVATLVVTLFAYLLLSAPAAHAATPDATWKQGSITYQDHTYTGPTKAKSGDGHELPADTILYTYLEAPAPFSNQKMHVIYFAPGSDPGKADTGTYVTYDRGPTGGLSNKSKGTTVTFKDASKTDTGAAAGSSDSDASSCKVDGIGWIVCPVTNFLSQGMDWVFNILSGFMQVQPLATSSGDNNVMMRVWNTMRGIANIAFVIAFLIIIYSQLTSTGVTNYGIKKLLPRLIIAAILVNVSYWICAIAIDISNILGYSIQDIFIGFRNNILGSGGNNWNLVSWESVSGFILSGGAAVGAGIAGLGIAATTLGAFSVGGVMLLLLPILLGALLTILVVLLILSARQAIIVILVIIAPLAFVAYLLPNTEKWFEKWRELFMTMLVFFPAFSLVFGGAQFAGIVIIQNAQNINMLLLGMAVQIAPLAITPLLLRLSGNLLGKVAGVINNPNKGLLDRTRNWSKERLDARRALENARSRKMAANGQLRRRHIGRRTALHFDNEKRMREGMKSINEADATSLFNQTASGRGLHEAEHRSHTLKENTDAMLNAHIQGEVNVVGSRLHLENAQLEANKARLAKETAITEEQLENYKTDLGQASAAFSPELSRATRAIQVSNEQVALHGIAKQNAQHVKQKEFAELLGIDDSDIKNPLYARSQQALRTAAGIDPGGKFNAQADAMSSLVTIEGEGLKKSIQYLNARAVQTGTTLQQYTANIVREAREGKGNYEPNIIKAALEQQAIEGQVGNIEDALGSYHIDRSIVADVIARNNGNMKAKGGYHIQADPMHYSIQAIQDENPGASKVEVEQIFKERLAAGRMNTLGDASAKDIAGWKVGYFKKIADSIEDQVTLARQYASRSGNTEEVEKSLEAAFANIHSAATSKDVEAEMSNRQDDLEHIYNAFRAKNIPLKSPAIIAYENKTEEERKIDGQPPEL